MTAAKKPKVSITTDDSDPVFRFTFCNKKYESKGPIDELVKPGYFRRNRNDQNEIILGVLELIFDDDTLAVIDDMSYQAFGQITVGVQEKIQAIMGASVGESAGSSSG